MSAPREHVRAVSERVWEQVGVTYDDIEQVCDQILTSTDPDVQAALLAALVRAGVLREESVASQCTHQPLGLHFCSGAVNRRYVTEWEAL